LEIQSLTVSERIIFAEALWDSVVMEGSEIELNKSQQEELNSRLAAFEIDQDVGVPWSSVKARILAKK